MLKFASTLVGAGAAILSLAGCAFVPSTGPSAGAVHNAAASTHDVSLVVVTPATAASMWAASQSEREAAIAAASRGLQASGEVARVQLYPGDSVNIDLWTMPLMAGIGGSSSSSQLAVEETKLGTFTVNSAGDITLPYAGTVRVSGRTVEAAERLVTVRYDAIHRFQEPQVTMSVATNQHQKVIVTGAANHPVVLDWKTGGITLSDAITEAGGYKTFQKAQGNAEPANTVIVVRGDKSYRLPMKVAITSDAPLVPGDRVVLERTTIVRVQCLGGGWGKDTQQDFDYSPTLAEVLAKGGGLNSQTAQGKAVYILSADQKTVYELNWDTLDGLRAAEKFPVSNGDVVYVANAPSVRFQQVVSILFSAAYPIATFHTVF
jgi:polysaccharide export outer membrane protein